MNTNADLLKELRIDRKAAPPPSRRGLWIALGVIAGVLLLAALGWALFARGKAIEVQVAEAAPMAGGGSASGSVLDASGYVVARRMATVSAKVPGKVRDVLIEEGQHVREGEIIATLDPIDASQQRALSAAQVEAARSQAGSLQAQLREAEANTARLGTLAQQQLVSKAQYEQAIAQRDALRAQLLTARQNAQVAERGLRIAAQGVDNTIVRAPFDGVVIAKAAQPGEIVSPMAAGGGFTRTGIGTIVDMDSLEVEVDVGESYIGRVKPGMPVESTLNAYPDWKIPGEVIAIIPTADRGKATVKVRVKLDTKDARVVPDMGVSVSFLEAARAANAAPPKGVRVPAGVIAQRNGKDVAFVIAADDKVSMREVTAGKPLGSGGDVQVADGLSVGERLVLDPPATLQDGQRVRPPPTPE